MLFNHFESATQACGILDTSQLHKVSFGLLQNAKSRRTKTNVSDLSLDRCTMYIG